MGISYKRLGKLLIDRDIKKKDLAKMAGISPATVAKMSKDNASVSSDVLAKICIVLNCTLNDIAEIIVPGQCSGLMGKTGRG